MKRYFFYTASVPELLNEERKNVMRKTQALAFENYQTFIQAAECSSEIYKDVSFIL